MWEGSGEGKISTLADMVEGGQSSDPWFCAIALAYTPPLALLKNHAKISNLPVHDRRAKREQRDQRPTYSHSR